MRRMTFRFWDDGEGTRRDGQRRATAENYSERRAVMGSVVAARWAGRRVARMETAIRTATAAKTGVRFMVAAP